MRSCFLSEILALTASIKYIEGLALNPVWPQFGPNPLVITPCASATHQRENDDNT